MAKGIIKDIPTITSRVHPGKVKITEVDNSRDEGLIGRDLEFAAPGFSVSQDDGVELTITSGTECNVTKIILSKGIVRDVPTYEGGQGKLMVTVATPNEKGIVKNKDLKFNNYTGVTLRQNDYVEFTNMTAIINDIATECDVIRKIESRGEITKIPINPETLGLINVKQAAENSGVTLGTNISFPLPTPTPTPFNLRDIVEINITNDQSCEYVQLLEPAP